MILSSALFIAIPALVTFTQPDVVTRALLSIVAVAWALAMTVFRSPAIALLGRYATPEALPLAGSLLTLVGGTINAFRGTANKFILSLGPVFTFAIGSFTLLAAAAALRFVNPPEKPVDKHHAEVLQLPLQKLGLIFLTGAGIAWGSRFLMDALGKVLKTQFNTDNIDLLMLWIGLTLAFSALPAGAFAVKIGNRKAMLLSIGVTVVAMGMLIYMGAQISIIFFIIPGFSVIVKGAVPFVLGLMPQRWGGLGVGTYFSGFGGGMSLFGVMFGQVQGIIAVMGVIEGAIAFLVAGGCIAASRRSN
ncbi:MAG: MFS transporter [Heteroscytonema crispum UTEX LB 1556]